MRERVELHDNQFGFRLGSRQRYNGCCVHNETSAGKILEKTRTFVDLEKAFDRVPREVVY